MGSEMCIRDSGGAPPKEQQDQVSVIPGMSGMTVSTSQVAGAGVDIPALDGKGEEGAPPVIAALRTTSTTSTSATSTTTTPSSPDQVSALRRRVAELEEKIVALTSQASDGDSDEESRVAELEALLKEKQNSEAELSSLVEKLDQQVKQQAKLLTTQDQRFKRQEERLNKQQRLIDKLLKLSGFKGEL